MVRCWCQVRRIVASRNRARRPGNFSKASHWPPGFMPVLLASSASCQMPSSASSWFCATGRLCLSSSCGTHTKWSLGNPWQCGWSAAKPGEHTHAPSKWRWCRRATPRRCHRRPG